MRAGIFDFRRMKDLLEEPIPISIEGFLDPVDFEMGDPEKAKLDRVTLE